MNQPFDLGGAHIGSYYMLQGTAAQVTAELDALVLTPETFGGPAEIGLDFGVTSSSGASSAESRITVDVSSEKPDGQGIVDVQSNDETIYLQPFDIVLNHGKKDTEFVFDAGDELSVIRGFKVGGTGHDTIDLPSADFRNFADMLRNTGDVNGSAFITDPKTGDAVRLAGVSTAELKAHPKDFSFHG